MADAKAVAIRFLAEQDRIAGIADDLCADGYVAHLAGSPPMDVEAHRSFAQAFYAAFEGFTHHIEDAVSNGERVVLRLRLTGVNTGSFMDNPPSGRPIDIGGLAMFTVDEGKVAELRAQFDQVGLMQQIGALSS
jgi:predicted ester cyclase